MRSMVTAAALLVASPALAGNGNLVCTLSLTACDLGRDNEGTCPLGAEARASLFAEGDQWLLDATGLNRGREGQTAGATETIYLMNAGTPAEGKRAFFVVGMEHLDGAFLIDDAGPVRATLFGFGEGFTYTDYFSGQCEAQ